MSRIAPQHYDDDLINRLIFSIEISILKTDTDAKAAGVRLSDSKMKSAVTRIKANLGATTPLPPRDDSPTEALLAKLETYIRIRISDIVLRRENETFEQGTPVALDRWRIAFDIVLKSMNTHKSGEPGTRDYLEFITDFLGGAEMPSIFDSV